MRFTAEAKMKSRTSISARSMSRSRQIMTPVRQVTARPDPIIPLSENKCFATDDRVSNSHRTTIIGVGKAGSQQHHLAQEQSDSASLSSLHIHLTGEKAGHSVLRGTG
jgi:hypothetical protein